MDDVFLHHAKGMEQQLLRAAEQVVFVDRGGGHALGKGFPERAVAVFRADFHKCLAEFERNGRVEQKCPAAGRGGRGDERLRSGVSGFRSTERAPAPTATSTPMITRTMSSSSRVNPADRRSAVGHIFAPDVGGFAFAAFRAVGAEAHDFKRHFLPGRRVDVIVAPRGLSGSW